MSYNDRGEYIVERVPGISSGDPAGYSSELLAKQVEEYLYDTQSPRFRDPHFLAWAVSAYDFAKQGSGRSYDAVDYTAGVANLPSVPAPPVAYPGKSKGDKPVYKVEYSRDDWNRGKVPTNYDGTQPEVYEHHVYQIVKPPSGGEG